VDLEQILAVLHGWLGEEIEVSAHGGQGMAPILAVSVRGRLRTGDVMSRFGHPEVFLFVLVDGDGLRVGSFALDGSAEWKSPPQRPHTPATSLLALGSAAR
jgi:hypothetical protein